MVSLSRASFSYTTPLMMMATEYIQARVMNRGMERLITRRNLGQSRQEVLHLQHEDTQRLIRCWWNTQEHVFSKGNC